MYLNKNVFNRWLATMLPNIQISMLYQNYYDNENILVGEDSRLVIFQIRGNKVKADRKILYTKIQ